MYNPLQKIPHATETPICIIVIKIVTYIFAAETVTCTSVAETSNCIIAIETVTCIIATEISTNIPVTESTTSKTCINATDVVTCIIAKESVSSIVPTEASTYRIHYRNFLFQKWCQKLCCILIIAIFYFRILIHFTNQITLKQSLAQKLYIQI